jgi:Putative zinc-binding metallo-peptidase
MLDDLKARYRTEITLPAEPFEVNSERGQYLMSIEGQPATSEEANWYIPLFVEEFGLYSRLFVENAKLTRIVLCGELFRSQKQLPAAKRFAGRIKSDRQPLSFEHKPCGGVPDGKYGILYLAVAWGRDDPEYVRKLIHHEFYHCVQWQQFGHSGDREWAALNSPDFNYGPGGLAANYGSDPTFWVMPAEEWGNGFLNQYSMSAPEEDQAEIFAHLLTKPARVDARLRADDILRRKVDRLKASLKRFCRDMDGAFWQHVEESRMPFER